jgi:ribonucleoside-triphosphate reductase
VRGISVSEELANFIFYSKYSRFRQDLNRRETWNECVERVEAMHVRKFPEYADDIINAFNYVRNKRVVPSMRSLQFGGKAIEKNNCRIYNCSLGHIDSIDSFSEYFYLLLSGCGVGVGLSQRHLNNLPSLVKVQEITNVYTSPLIYVIQDSIEGWADSLKVLLQSYFLGFIESGKYIKFDYSLIRPKGSPLQTSGGTAPGPEGLRFAHEKIRKVLDKAKSKIKSIEVYDILMHVADAVLSGGIRRSATIMVFEPDDMDMILAKTGDWFDKNPQRARSNNSVRLLRNKATIEEMKFIVQQTKQWGEPGFVFANHPDELRNPCGEVSCIPIKDGRCGWQMCNLTSINGNKINSEQDFYDCAKIASFIGTLQASYTDFPYLRNSSKEITDEEALLGVSIISMLANSDVLLNPQVQQNAAKIVVDTNKEWAKKLGINQAARTTLVKPDGTCALALGSMLSGIHPAHARKMFRRVQCNKQDPVYKFFRKHNQHLCEESIYSPTHTDEVITFPVDVDEKAIIKSELSDVEHLKLIRNTQENWVEPGNTEANRKPISHSVSCTVQVSDWDAVVNYLYDNRDFFSAVSLVPSTADKIYSQAPMQSAEDDLSKFNEMKNSFTPVDYTQLIETKDVTQPRYEIVCSGNACDFVSI